MAKFIFLVISLWILNVARTFPMISENEKKINTSAVFNGESKYAYEDGRVKKDGEIIPNAYVEGVQTQLSQQLLKSGRRKRSIINGGVCPAGQVWKPRPFYCITCERYEELSGNDCYE